MSPVARNTLYDSDIHEVIRLVSEAVTKHKSVLSGTAPSDTELRGLGDSGVNMAVDFWSKGLDDGNNEFTADILLVIRDTLKANDISTPFP